MNSKIFDEMIKNYDKDTKEASYELFKGLVRVRYGIDDPKNLIQVGVKLDDDNKKKSK